MPSTIFKVIYELFVCFFVVSVLIMFFIERTTIQQVSFYAQAFDGRFERNASRLLQYLRLNKNVQ
jgi:hypothetical protein